MSDLKPPATANPRFDKFTPQTASLKKPATVKLDSLPDPDAAVLHLGVSLSTNHATPVLSDLPEQAATLHLNTRQQTAMRPDPADVIPVTAKLDGPRLSVDVANDISHHGSSSAPYTCTGKGGKASSKVAAGKNKDKER